ncbi:MAG TPA: hypothetical protein PLS12_11630 [Bacteroidales bacterium]|nr:hypothetical protein [Bacteroidales bacterium]
MNTVFEQAKQKRTFVSPTISIDSWQSIQPYFEYLQNRFLNFNYYIHIIST